MTASDVDAKQDERVTIMQAAPETEKVVPKLAMLTGTYTLEDREPGTIRESWSAV